jgi:hypothetical protein
MSRPHKEYEKNVIHPVVQRFLEDTLNLTVYPNVSIPLTGDYPKPVSRIQMDLLGLGENCSVLVECKAQTVPYSFALGLGELLLYWKLLHEKKLQVEEKLAKKMREPIKIHEPIRPLLSVVDLGHSQNVDWYRYTAWSKNYLKLHRRLACTFKDFKPQLLLVKRKIGVDKPAQDVTASDLRCEILS